MKKVIAIAVLGLAATVSGWAQGKVDFRNGGISFVNAANRYVYTTAGVGPGAGTPPGATDANRLIGTTYAASLWYVAGANAGGQIASAKQVGRAFNFRADTTSAGNRGTWTAGTFDPVFTFTDVGFNAAVTLQVRVWDTAKFTSFEAAVAGNEYGASLPFNYTTPADGTLTPNSFYMDNLRAFAIVPEPSTIALGILGAASLLFLRRRK
jgi:hypothetical protein